MKTELSKIYLKINELLAKEYPDVYAAFLTGSFADGSATDESDIDVWIITNSRDYVLNETFIRDGDKYQINCIPLGKVEELLWLDTFTKNGIFNGAFVKARILKDQHNYLKNIIAKCIEVERQGPENCSVQEINKKKVQLYNYYCDLKGAKSKQESYIVAYELLQAFFLYYVSDNRLWSNGGGKYLSKIVEKYNERFFNESFNHYERFVKTLDKGPFLEFISENVDGFNSFENGYTIANSLVEVKENYIVIQIYNINKFNEFCDIELPIILSKSSLKDRKLFYFRSRAIGDSLFNYDSFYIVVFADPELINNHLIPVLNQDFLRTPTVYKFNFPVNFDLALLLGDKVLVKLIAEWIYEFSSTIIIRIRESISFATAVELTKLVYTRFFNKDISKFSEFLAFLLESWFVLAYDNGRFTNTHQLSISKEGLLENFERQFTDQKQQLMMFFNDDEMHFIDSKQQINFDQLVKALNERNSLNSMKSHPVYLFKGEYHKPLESWVILRSFLRTAMSSIMIPENNLAYVPYCVGKILNNH